MYVCSPIDCQKYDICTLDTFLHIVTHEDKRTVEDLFHRSYIASWLLRLLKKSPYFPKHVKTPDTVEAKLSDGELYIGGLILHNLMTIQFNAHEVSYILFFPRN